MWSPSHASPRVRPPWRTSGAYERRLSRQREDCQAESSPPGELRPSSPGGTKAGSRGVREAVAWTRWIARGLCDRSIRRKFLLPHSVI